MILGEMKLPKNHRNEGRSPAKLYTTPGKVVYDTRQSCAKLLGKLKNKYYKYFNPQPPTLVGGLLYF